MRCARSWTPGRRSRCGVGVNTGKVFTGDFGPPYRRAYRVFGDAINTAARVMSRADAGQILSTEIVLERSRTTFETTPIEPFRAKGKAEPVRASIVGSVVGTRGERAAETPLVGRDRELDSLSRDRRRVRGGSGWIVEISGAAGIGKSRLVHEFTRACPTSSSSTPAARSTRPRRHTSRCGRRCVRALGLDRSADGREVEQRLREVVERANPALAPWIPLLGILLGLDLPATPETERSSTSASCARRSPTSPCVSSSQSSPARRRCSSSRTSTSWTRRAPIFCDGSRERERHCASCSSSPTPARARRGRRPMTTTLRCSAFTLLPLSQRDMVEIVAVATDERPLQPHEVEEIARRSGGSPLFLFELLDMVRATGSTEALPDSVEAVIAADIDRLSPSDRTMLRYASVLGAQLRPRTPLCSARGAHAAR